MADGSDTTMTVDPPVPAACRRPEVLRRRPRRREGGHRVRRPARCPHRARRGGRRLGRPVRRQHRHRPGGVRQGRRRDRERVGARADRADAARATTCGAPWAGVSSAAEARRHLAHASMHRNSRIQRDPGRCPRRSGYLRRAGRPRPRRPSCSSRRCAAPGVDGRAGGLGRPGGRLGRRTTSPCCARPGTTPAGATSSWPGRPACRAWPTRPTSSPGTPTSATCASSPRPGVPVVPTDLGRAGRAPGRRRPPASVVVKPAVERRQPDTGRYAWPTRPHRRPRRGARRPAAGGRPAGDGPALPGRRRHARRDRAVFLGGVYSPRRSARARCSTGPDVGVEGLYQEEEITPRDAVAAEHAVAERGAGGRPGRPGRPALRPRRPDPRPGRRPAAAGVGAHRAVAVPRHRRRRGRALRRRDRRSGPLTPSTTPEVINNTHTSCVVFITRSVLNPGRAPSALLTM